MIKKLLFIFITIFAFSNVNSQSAYNLDGQLSGGCGNGNFEFKPVANVNGKHAYIRSDGTDSGIRWDTTDNRWELWRNGNINDIVFIQESDSSGNIEVPFTGWIGDGSPCGAGVSVEFSEGVLSIDNEELSYNKISIYPNPSSDFISVTNLKETTKIKITNITGQTIMSDLIDQNNNQIDIKNLSKGFYFVEIEGKKTIKLIKK